MNRNTKLTGDVKAIEDELARHSAKKPYILLLFVAGSTLRSARAIQNLQAICEEQFPGRYELKVIDIYQHPEQVAAEQIVVAPTLVKKLPLPVRRIVGDLSARERVLRGLDLVHRSATTRL